MHSFACRLGRANTWLTSGKERTCSTPVWNLCPCRSHWRQISLFFFYTNLEHARNMKWDTKNRHDGDGLNATVFLWLYVIALMRMQTLWITSKQSAKLITVVQEPVGPGLCRKQVPSGISSGGWEDVLAAAWRGSVSIIHRVSLEDHDHVHKMAAVSHHGANRAWWNLSSEGTTQWGSATVSLPLLLF